MAEQEAREQTHASQESTAAGERRLETMTAQLESAATTLQQLVEQMRNALEKH